MPNVTKWKTTVNDEYNSFFKKKKSSILKYQCYFVTRGFSQELGLDYHETFSLTW